MIRSLPITLTACLLHFFISQAAAQSFQPKTIQFKGDSEYTDAELAAAANLNQGISLTSAQMNEHTKLLMDTGMFSDIAFTFNGRDLIFKIVPTTPLFSVRFENFPAAVTNGIDQRLKDKVPLYRGMVPSSGGILDSIQTELKDELAAVGVRAALEVTPYTDPDLHKVTAMSFAITDPDVEVGEIQIVGASAAIVDKARLAVAKTTGTTYSADGSASQLETSIVNLYGSLGYIQAKAHAAAVPQIQLVTGAVRIPFTLQVEEGLQYKLAGVQLSPGLIINQAEFDKISGLRSGDVVSLPKLRANWQLLTHLYHNHGYMKAVVHDAPTFDPTQATVSYLVTADAGPVYNTGKIKVKNAPDDVRELILSALKLPPGEPFNESAVRGISMLHGVNPVVEKLFTIYKLSYSLARHDDLRTVDVEISLEPKHPD